MSVTTNSMKNFSLGLSIIVLFFFAFTLLNCGNDEPSAQEVQLKKLTQKTWQIQSVNVNGVDQTMLFLGMTLSIAKNSFTTTAGGTVWPSSGTWEFADDKATTFTRGDNVLVTIEAISESHMTLTLVWDETTFGPGRKKSISGMHVFNFN
jgi:hypothetical protein